MCSLLIYFVDTSINLIKILYQTIKRFSFLILLPGLVYITAFYIHINILSEFGPGVGIYSVPFQLSLNGCPLGEQLISEKIASGSVVSLKGARYDAYYLHSHPQFYPEEHPPKQQQVTGYPHIDSNSLWTIIKYDILAKNNHNISEYIFDNDLIVLHHIKTGKNLHSHKEKAPISTKKYQVSCYGMNGVGDKNDVWRIKIKNTKNYYNGITPINSQFKLVHAIIGCELMESGETLPHWGYYHREIICNTQKNHIWNSWSFITNQHPLIKKVKAKEIVKISFIQKFIESHERMFTVNKNLVPKAHEITSQPWHWPFNIKGIHFSILSYHRVYMLGNPILYWAIVFIIPAYVVLSLLFLLDKTGRLKINEEFEWIVFRAVRYASEFFVGWIIHYTPYFFMRRVLYFHHYMPAYLFYSMFAGTMINFSFTTISLVASPSKKMRRIIKNTLNGILFSLMIISFKEYLFLAYGMTGPSSQEPGSPYKSHRLLDSWEF